MPYEVDDDVQVTARVLYRDGEGDSQLVNLTNENGTVKKVDKGCLYVETQYGTHYLKDDKVSPV